MFLKEIELENFKSFGKKTKISINNGFSAVCGPNGSGKSNISDAILFTIGPKSTKVIRAQKLTDLIYNGGGSGKPADYCKVSLVFDNNDRLIPVNNDEVTFTRYIKRSDSEEGYNSYFYVNGDKARLLDFTDLLSQAKIFADGYNFVQQGDITKVVEMTPVERRKVLEEIAGITKYDEEIQNAEIKKRNVEENLSSVELLMKEIELRIEGLSKDREVALKYLEIKNMLNLAKAQFEKKKLISINSEIEGDLTEIEKIRGEITKLTEKIQELNDTVAKTKEQVQEIEKKIEESGGNEERKLKNEIDSCRIEIGKLGMKTEDSEELIASNKEQVRKLETEIKDLKKNLKEKEDLRKSVTESHNQKSKNLNEMRTLLSEKNNKISEFSEDVKKLQNKLMQELKNLEFSRADYNKKVEEYNKIKSKIEVLIEAIAKLEEDKKTYELEIKDSEWRIKESKDADKSSERKFKELQDRYFKLSNQEQALKKELDQLYEEIKALTKDYERIQARIDGSKVSAAYRILSARDHNELKGIIGTVSELITIPKEYEMAIEIVAGARLESVIVENDEVGAQAISYLKSRLLGRATFLPLNKMMMGRPRGKALVSAKEEGVIGFAIDLISFKKEYETAMWYVFGDTLICKNLDIARKLMGGIRIVTLDGQLIEASGAMVGGGVEQKSKKFSMQDLDQIGRRLREKNVIKDQKEIELNDISKQIQELTAQIREMNMKSGFSAEMEIWEKTKNEYSKKLEGVLKELKSKNEDKTKFEQVFDSLDKELVDLKSLISAKLKDTEKLRSEIDLLTPQKLKDDINRIKGEIDKLEQEVGELNKSKEQLNIDIVLSSNKINDDTKLLESTEQALITTQQNLKNFMDAKKEYEIKLRKLLEVEKTFEVRLQELLKERDKLNGKLMEIDNDIYKNNESIKRKNDFIITLETRINQNRALYEESKREFELMGIEVELPLPSMDQVKRTISDSEALMKSLEPVNMKSIDEYNIEKERYDNLKKDFDRLSSERRDLIELMSQLNEKKKTGLVTVFKAIKENFEKIYPALSEGGEAQIYLENETDPFEGGLIIKAKPKGKKFTRLESLSGGEKSLTALTFIFAIQNYDPSPIYVLDEVDMFLDSVNAEAVARMIKNNADKAQFLMISLKEITMKYADYIFGVTTADDGLTRVFSQSISDLKDLEVMLDGS